MEASKHVSIHLVLSILVTVFHSFGCADHSDPQSDTEEVSSFRGFAEWRDSLSRDETTSYFIVEGDILIPESKLQQYYERNVGTPNALSLHTTSNDGMPVTDVVWDPVTRKKLTWCVSKAWSDTYGPAGKATLLLVLANAANAWSAATNNEVVFRHIPEEDDAKCTTSNNNVHFNVELNRGQACNGANCGFFPDAKDWPRSKRVLYLNTGFLGVPAANQMALAMHELGHVLGFAHEHSWLYALYGLDCGGSEAKFTPLTRYDNNSIMFYNPCIVSDAMGKPITPNLAGPNAETVLSVYDKRGAACAYQGKCEWAQLSGPNTVSDIDINQQAVIWSVSTTTKDTRGYYIQQWNGSGWSRLTNSMAPGAMRITVDTAGNPWWVTSNGQIWHLVNGAPILESGSANDISAGADGSIWIVTRTAGTGGNQIAKRVGSSFQVVSGINGVNISADRSGNPFVIKSDSTIWHYENGAFKQWPGAAVDIDAGSDGSVWAIGTAGNIFQWNTGGFWELVTGAGARVAVAQNGQPWVVGFDFTSWINVWVP